MQMNKELEGGLMQVNKNLNEFNQKLMQVNSCSFSPVLTEEKLEEGGDQEEFSLQVQGLI